jgi:hypothetical protein
MKIFFWIFVRNSYVRYFRYGMLDIRYGMLGMRGTSQKAIWYVRYFYSWDGYSVFSHWIQSTYGQTLHILLVHDNSIIIQKWDGMFEGSLIPHT